MNAGAKGGGGFTIVELIVVVILLAVLGTVAIARMVKPTTFAASVVGNGLREAYSGAVQLAVNRQDTTVTTTLSDADPVWRLDVSTALDGVVRRVELDRDSTTIEAINGAAATTLAAGDTVVLSFASTGALDTLTIAGAPADASLGLQLGVAGDSVFILCVHPTGFTADAACQ